MLQATKSALGSRLRRGQHGVVGGALWLLFLALALFGVGPVRTCFYAAAWYPALLVLDALIARRSEGRSPLLDHPLAVASLFAWSVPFWLLFEAINLRIENWYYVGSPADPVHARLYLVLSFATVLPGLFLTYELLKTFPLFRDTRWPALPVTLRLQRVLFYGGVACVILPILLPRFFYPLVWLFLFLLLEPGNRRSGWPCLLRDLEHGRPRRLLLLLVAGGLCGLYWELMNMPAGARWIYTVPFFDLTLGMEMPPLGFVGFLPFAVSAYSFVRALEIHGLSVPWEHGEGTISVWLPGWTRVLALPAAIAAGSLLTVAALERHTIDSRTARVDDLSLPSPREKATLNLAGLDRVAELAAIDDEAGLARRLLATDEHAARVLAEARLADLRGIGTHNAAALWRVGVRSIDQLARADPEQLYRTLRGLEDMDHVRPQRVRVWVRAAQRRHP